jgi:cell division septation protein DedD
MAEIDFDEYGAAPRFPMIQTQRFVNMAGAVCSIGLLAGVAVWGYNLAVRDVSGVPVIRAQHDPLRVAPANPGGTIADHQGMAVNAIAELGAAEPLPDQIILAPEPVQLDLDDTPGLVAGSPVTGAPPIVIAEEPAAITAPRQAPLSGVSDVLAETVSDPSAEPAATSDAVAAALAEALGIDEASLTQVEPTGAVQASGAGLARSLRPMPRPATAAKRLTVDAAPIPAVAMRMVDPAALAPGARLVQLGAFDTVELAQGEWARLAERFGDLMSGKGVVVQPAESGGRVFYRLRAEGFEGEDDARRFCSALEAEDATCVPVVHR